MSKEPPAVSRLHHDYSPSKLQFLEACPGFEGMQSTNAASELGTKIHDAIESGKYEGQGFTDEQIDAIIGCIAYYQAAVAEWPGATLYTEVYLPIDADNTTAGYIDIGIVSADGKHGKIKDWKTGQNAVEPAENNLQGMAYLLGLLFNHAPNLEDCEVEFVMPFQGQGGIVDRHTFKRAEFAAMHLRIKTIVARAKVATAAFKEAKAAGKTCDHPSLTPNTSTCLFCANLAHCHAVQKVALAVGKKYNPLVVPDSINPSLITNPVTAGRALEFFAVIAALASAYRQEATNKALTDENFMPEGYQIVTSVRRKVEDNLKFAQTLQDYGFTQEEIMQCCEFTLGPAEKVASNKAERGEKKAAVEGLALMLSSNGATTEGAPVSMLKKKKVSAPVEIA